MTITITSIIVIRNMCWGGWGDNPLILGPGSSKSSWVMVYVGCSQERGSHRTLGIHWDYERALRGPLWDSIP